MNPYFEIFWYPVYIFGLSIVVCFFLFLWMLKKLSIRFSFAYHFFTNSILWYFLSVFIFSRLFYVISMWKDMKYIQDPFDFFIMSDYNFSLFGALFGFFAVLFLNVKLLKKSIHKYIDWFMLSFLFVSILWFIWAFFGGQVYGEITSLSIGVAYDNGLSSVPLTWELFPLALVYSGICCLLFSILYILSMYVKTRGIIGYVWLGIFSAIVLALEFFSWKPDIFSVAYSVNLSQIWAIIFIVISFYWIFRVMNIYSKSQKTILWDVTK